MLTVIRKYREDQKNEFLAADIIHWGFRLRKGA
jgi:hypothetical protein